MKRGLSVVALVLLIAAGCASSLGNRDPIRRSSLAWRVQPGTTAEQAGDFVKQGAYTFALIAAAQDSAWFASVATGAGLSLSGPGRTGGRGMAFMTPTDLEICMTRVFDAPPNLVFEAMTKPEHVKRRSISHTGTE